MKNKKKRVKVSVIIPVYNVEKYLRKCLDSVVNQSIKELEIIIVNDGSKDNSLEIMQEYAKNDTRIKIIDKENSGYGNSMNRGLEAASGEYIGIVESDDFISEKMYETLYGLTMDGTVDVVKGNFFDYYWDPIEKDKLPRAVVNTDRNGVKELEKPFVLKDNPQILWGHPSVWSAIYRTDFLKKKNIKFVEEDERGWEDNPFFHETLCKAGSIMWTNEPLYYYWRDNPESSSNLMTNPHLPFLRMEENLDILEQNGYTSDPIYWRAYARAIMYLNGALKDFDYDAKAEEINEYAKKLMRKMKEDVIASSFSLTEQLTYYTYASPIKSIAMQEPKILIYNWLPFDNQWNWGGGVTVYCKNVIAEILKQNPNVNIYFLSSGFAYSAEKDVTYVRKIDNVFGERVHQYEIVNSPVPAEQRWMYVNPLVALENQKLKKVVSEFIETYGPFKAIHFNNIEGLSLDVLDLKENYPDTRFIFSIHNYVPLCVNGSYYMRHKHCNCNPEHTGEDCFLCTRADIRSNISLEQYKRGTYGVAPGKCISQNRWIKAFGFERLDHDVAVDEILDFAKTATQKLNKNCDSILAVSKRVYDIAADNGFDEQKMRVSYIGTRVAERQTGHASAEVKDGLKIVFLGSDINFEEKGYPFLLDALSQMDRAYASKIDLVLTVKQAEHAEIYKMLKDFRDIKVIQGYTHDDLEWIFEDCNLSIVPVLWEDNLPQIAIESVAYGVPVLASSAGGASELCDSELFRYECGNAQDMRNKIIHFLDEPEDLQEYWKNHHGLVTMEMHWKELSGFYGLTENQRSVEIPYEEWCWLLKEYAFLHKSIGLNKKDFTTIPLLEKLERKLQEAKEENEKLRSEVEKMEKISGKVIFQTDYDPVQGDVGANLFKFILPDFNYSDFYAEIKFIKLENVGASVSDVLNISGTWHKKEDEYVLSLHQIDWEKGEGVLKNWIYYYIRDNAVYFFGRYAGRACGYSYEIQTLTSRAERDAIEFEALNEGFVWENEMRPEDAFNKLQSI